MCSFADVVGLKVALLEIMNDDMHWYTMISHLTHGINEAKLYAWSEDEKGDSQQSNISRIPPPPNIGDSDDLRQF